MRSKSILPGSFLDSQIMLEGELNAGEDFLEKVCE